MYELVLSVHHVNPGDKLRLSGLVESTFTSRAISSTTETFGLNDDPDAQIWWMGIHSMIRFSILTDTTDHSQGGLRDVILLADHTHGS